MPLTEAAATAIAAGVSAAAGLVGTGVNAGIQTNTNKLNRKEQKELSEWNKAFSREQFDYQKWLNQETMNRQDTAVQRSVQDYQAAGFNKLLATQNVSDSGNVTGFSSGDIGNAYRANAPEINASGVIDNALNAQRIVNETKLADANANLMNKKAGETDSKVKLNNSMIEMNNSLTDFNAVKTGREYINMMRNFHDYQIEQEGVIKSNDTSTPNSLYSSVAMLTKLLAKKMGIDIYEIGGEEVVKNIEKLQYDGKMGNNQYNLEDWQKGWAKLEEQLEKASTEQDMRIGIKALMKYFFLGPDKVD